MKNRLLTGAYTAILFLSYNAALFAQDDEDDIDEHPADDDPDPSAVPIDHHLLWLLFAGLLFAYFIYRRRKFFIR